MTESQTQTSSHETISRPPVVWIAQIVCLLLALTGFLLLVRSFFSVINHPIGLVRTVFGLSGLGLYAGLPTAAFWGLMKKKQWGRRLAASLILLLWGFVFYTQLYPSPNAYTFDNETQRIAGLVTMVLINVFFATLVFRLAFAKKVTRFFQS